MGTSNPPFKLTPRGKCDSCGKITHLCELEFDGQYTGMLVCDQCWNPRHPQLDMRGKMDQVTVFNARHVETAAQQLYSTEGDYTEANVAAEFYRKSGTT